MEIILLAILGATLFTSGFVAGENTEKQKQVREVRCGLRS